MIQLDTDACRRPQRPKWRQRIQVNPEQFAAVTKDLEQARPPLLQSHASDKIDS